MDIKECNLLKRTADSRNISPRNTILTQFGWSGSKLVAVNWMCEYQKLGYKWVKDFGSLHFFLPWYMSDK